MPATDAATAVFFDVVIDGVELGTFTGCEGLSAEYEVQEYQEGGENTFTHRLPGRLKFGTVKLTRLVDADSAGLASWVSGLRTSVQRKTAAITAYGGGGKVMARWNLSEVWPVKWTGPSFSTDQSGVAKETLELAHNGFFE